MTAEEFKAAYEEKGFSPKTLAERWGFTSATRIHQLAKKHTPLHVDAVRGLPYLEKKELNIFNNRY
jgi:hypothetical protein